MGHDCANKGEDGGDSTIGLLITLLVISMTLIAVIGYMIRQVQSYRTDATNYMSLHGTEMTKRGGHHDDTEGDYD
jgi:hypothetical protein